MDQWHLKLSFMSAFAYVQSRQWLKITLLVTLFAGISWGLLAPNAFRFLRSSPYSPIALLNDAMLHCCSFATVTLVFSLLLGKGDSTRLRTIAYLLAAQGLITELMQAFIPTRTCDAFDLAANFVGVAVGHRLAVMYFREQRNESMSRVSAN